MKILTKGEIFGEEELFTFIVSSYELSAQNISVSYSLLVFFFEFGPLSFGIFDYKVKFADFTDLYFLIFLLKKYIIFRGARRKIHNFSRRAP